MQLLTIFLGSTLLNLSAAFVVPINRVAGKADLSMAATEAMAIKTITPPDFYWKFRLDRLAGKKGADLKFKAENYPDISAYKDLYDAYYLDLTLQGKLDGFDWSAEKKISDSEWQSIYKTMCSWSEKVAKPVGTDSSNLPEDDLDLLAQFYPQIDMRELEQKFVPNEVGPNFPYNSMKEMFSAAGKEGFAVPGYSSTGSLEATEAKAAVKQLKEKTMTKLDNVLDDTMAYATAAFPDDQSRTHYQTLRSTLADFPSDAAGWKALRSSMDKEVDEMARLAAKKVDEHHGHDDEGGMSPAEEFEAKYGRSLDEMQERMNAFKADPVAFLESSILLEYGSNGLDVWKKSQEFSESMASMSESEKAATEAKFSDFLKKA